ncbi:MAG: copper transporter [Firmicutes bacterium]|nr:copper transporter [Bacillota bacterium]
MLDFRYHLLTLTAVFLSLTLGIFIGTALPTTEMVLGEQQNVIAELEATFSELRHEANIREAELTLVAAQKQAAEDLARLVLPSLIADRLSEQKLGLIAIDTNNIREVKDTLATAGADIIWEFYWEPNAANAWRGELGKQLALYLTGQSSTPPWEGCALPEGLPTAVDAVVLLGSLDKETLAMAESLGQVLKGNGMRVVGFHLEPMEPTGESLECLSFEQCAIPVVSGGTESPVALASLVALLSGSEEHYRDGDLPLTVLEWGEQR